MCGRYSGGGGGGGGGGVARLWSRGSGDGLLTGAGAPLILNVTGSRVPP